MAVALVATVALACPSGAQSTDGAERFDAGRFTVLAFPQDRTLAQSLLAAAQANDTFPGLPRPTAHATIALAPDDARFREWVGAEFPEWGAAAAFPSTQRIVMHGRRAGSDAGNPLEVLRHELAHLALGEFMGDIPPRWFDEGYAGFAAGEWGREEVLATSVALVFRGPRTLEGLDSLFYQGTTRATAAYALAYRAVVELAAMDQQRGLSIFLANWRESGSMEIAVRRSYGITLDAFEDRWRSRTRRRYGGLAIVADLALLGGVVGVLVLPVYMSRRKRQRQRLERLRNNEDEQERRARASALDAMLSGTRAESETKLLDTPEHDL